LSEEAVKVSEDGKTWTIREDVCEEIERRARREGKTVKQYVSEHWMEILIEMG